MQSTDVTLLASTTTWVEIGLVIFLVVFLMIVAWVLLARPGAFNDAARIPLDDQEVVTPRKDAAPDQHKPALEPNHGK